MSSEQIAISVSGLSKCYQIYDNPRDRLKQFVAGLLSRILKTPPKHYFREFWALNDVTFEVKKGETIGIIGRNGSGKSTLLQMICGTLTPTSGSVRTHGRVAALLELGSGFNAEFTGRENVYMNASVLGLSTKEIDERFDDIVQFADIGDFIDQPVKTYSSGMYVRLAFAVIAHVDADILVVDEALAVGDAFFTQKCMRFLRSFMEKGTILFVSHDTGAVINLCNRAILLGKGSIQLKGDPKDVAQKYLVDLYASIQGESITVAPMKAKMQEPVNAEVRDMRLDFINSTKFRNDIELFDFRPDAGSFGKGHGLIKSVQLLDPNGHPLSWVVGGEDVILSIRCLATDHIFSPIIGFYVNDRLGQPLFGDNTFNFSQSAPLNISAGESFLAEFKFRMPILPRGDYSVTASLAAGTQTDHIQHHWIPEALLLKSHTSSVSTGLVGVPMREIRISKT
jgi:lipopolysaccharide transport system ATP-binding protein